MLFFVTTSPSREWVICAPAAFLGCGSRFSGSLSGIEPRFPVTRGHHGRQREYHRKLIGQTFERDVAGSYGGGGGLSRSICTRLSRVTKSVVRGGRLAAALVLLLLLPVVALHVPRSPPSPPRPPRPPGAAPSAPSSLRASALPAP